MNQGVEEKKNIRRGEDEKAEQSEDEFLRHLPPLE